MRKDRIIKTRMMSFKFLHTTIALCCFFLGGMFKFSLLQVPTTIVITLGVFVGGIQCRLTNLGTQGVNLLRLKNGPGETVPTGTVRLETAVTAASFPQYNFTQPLDHFIDTGFVFNQRYWVSDRHYQPGGPVVVLDGGETSGEDRLPYLDTGIVDILTSATNGLGVILEHRYYGASIPVDNFTTDSLRYEYSGFLNADAID